MIRRYIIHLALISLLFISISCGDNGGIGESDDAPSDATITMSPASNTVTVAAGYPLTTYSASFTILVADANGIPLNDVDITISYPWASTSTTVGVVQFYDGNPSEGASPVNNPTTATTDKNGTYTIWFEYTVGDTDPLTADSGDLAYKGDFQVTSGSLFSSATFEVAVGE